MELSIREDEVIYELVQGYQKKEIADRMCLSIHTVDTHFKNVKSKTGAKNIADLVRMYILSNKKMFFAITLLIVQSISMYNSDNQLRKGRKLARRVKVSRTKTS
jgi:DNA-binding CsgD family transcriptional regulator